MADKSKLKFITEHLIYKDNAYWLTCEMFGEDGPAGLDIIPQEWEFNNGFESPAEAFSYLHSLQSSPDVREEYNDKEEERLKEMGETE